MGGMQKWAPTYTLFHWGPIAWSFYIVLAVAFGFMIHVRGREKQKFSEACRPILGDKVDGIWGRVIDLLAVIALLAGTATTFSLATPLLSAALCHVFGLTPGIALTILILLMIAFVYTLTVWFGMKGVSRLASICAYLFFVLLAYVLIGGGECRYIIETGVSSIGNLVQNFVGMATGSCERDLFCTGLEYLLLGVLDGMVCGDSVLYRNYQQGKNCKEYSSRCIWMWACRNLYVIHRSGELWIVTADKRNTGCSGRTGEWSRYSVCHIGGFEYIAGSEVCADYSCYYDDCVLFYNI